MNYAFLKEYIERWRHTRGYGVHSPLAYRIVKDCVHPDRRYALYSDAYLDFEYNEERKRLKNAKMTLRLINLLRPKRIWAPGADKRLCKAMKMSFPKIQLATQKECPKNVDFIICHSRDYNAMWGKMDTQPECGMIVFGKNVDGFKGATLILTSKTYSIILRREGMDFVSYTV